MCPNCGKTINLLNRKKTDFHLIAGATRRKPRTFTELLHITRLPRKTLSLRLKELCGNGNLVKKEGMYMLNGSSPFASEGGRSVERISRLVHDRRMRTGLMLAALLVSFSVSGYVFATLFNSPSPSPSSLPSYIGTFTVDLKVDGATDVFAWQVNINFNASELVFVKATEGDFLNPNTPYSTIFLCVDDTEPGGGELLLYGSRKGIGVHGASGDGTLATVTFGYKTGADTQPRIVKYDNAGFDTWLLNSNLQNTAGVLKLEIG
jgi:DNA-binding HxlR family transcriptional regulator